MLLGLGWAIGKTAWGECLEAKEALSILWDDGKLLFCKPERPCPRWDEDTSFLDEEHQKLMLQALVLHDLPHPFHDIKEQASQGKISKLHYSFWHSGFVGQRPFINDAFNRTQFELAISGAVRGYRAMGEVEGLDIGALVVQKRVLKRLLWTEYRIDWCRRNARGLPQPPLASSANKTYRHPYYGTLKVPRSR